MALSPVSEKHMARAAPAKQTYAAQAQPESDRIRRIVETRKAYAAHNRSLVQQMQGRVNSEAKEEASDLSDDIGPAVSRALPSSRAVAAPRVNHSLIENLDLLKLIDPAYPLRSLKVAFIALLEALDNTPKTIYAAEDMTLQMAEKVIAQYQIPRNTSFGHNIRIFKDKTRKRLNLASLQYEAVPDPRRVQNELRESLLKASGSAAKIAAVMPSRSPDAQFFSEIEQAFHTAARDVFVIRDLEPHFERLTQILSQRKHGDCKNPDLLTDAINHIAYAIGALKAMQRIEHAKEVLGQRAEKLKQCHDFALHTIRQIDPDVLKEVQDRLGLDSPAVEKLRVLADALIAAHKKAPPDHVQLATEALQKVKIEAQRIAAINQLNSGSLARIKRSLFILAIHDTQSAALRNLLELHFSRRKLEREAAAGLARSIEDLPAVKDAITAAEKGSVAEAHVANNFLAALDQNIYSQTQVKMSESYSEAKKVKNTIDVYLNPDAKTPAIPQVIMDEEEARNLGAPSWFKVGDATVFDLTGGTIQIIHRSERKFRAAASGIQIREFGRDLEFHGSYTFVLMPLPNGNYLIRETDLFNTTDVLVEKQSEDEQEFYTASYDVLGGVDNDPDPLNPGIRYLN